MDQTKNRLLFGNMIVMALILVSLWTGRSQAAPGDAPALASLGSGFTYEGRIPVTLSGLYDFKFRLFDASTAGTLVVATVASASSVAVQDGEYIATVNFGAGAQAAFTGDARFLEVRYRPHSTDPAAPYTLLGGARPQLLQVPYATSLRPGAVVRGNVPMPGRAVVRADNTGTGAGLWGSATSNAGVYGEATTGIGVRGITQAEHTIDQPAIYGTSTGTGGIGVIGEANIGNSWGVYGTSTDGTGVYAASTAGIAIHAAGDATQDRNNGGWVKAMAYIDPGQADAIRQCYNSQAPRGQASSGDCGFTYTRWTPFGYHQINFGFPVNDRFVMVTVTRGSGEGQTTGGNVDQTSEPDEVLVRTYYTVFDPYGPDNTFRTTDTPFFIVVY